MKRIKARLHSRDGVSILYSLLFLMVASMVAVVILDASVTATKRVRDEQRSQQATLTLASGGKLMGQMLKETSVTVSTTINGAGIEEKQYVGEGPLGALLANAAEYANTFGTYQSHNTDNPFLSNDIVIKLQVPGDPDASSEVVMQYIMYKEKEAEAGDLDNKLSFFVEGFLTVDGSDEKLKLSGYANKQEAGAVVKYTWTLKQLEGGVP